MKVERRSDQRPHTQKRKEEAEADLPATPAGADHEAWGELGQREKSPSREHNKSGERRTERETVFLLITRLYLCFCYEIVFRYK